MIDFENIYHYNIILTKKCNMDCLYCVQMGKNRKFKKNLEKEISAEEMSNYFPANKYYEITFFGGEPLLNAEYMLNLASKIREKNKLAKFSVVTNGWLLTEELVSKINQLDIRVTLSHDGVCYKDTRKQKDILDVKGDIIAKINKLGFICVITSKNWNFYDNWQLFEDFRNKFGIQRPTVCITSVRDLHGNIDPSLFVYQNKDFELMLDKVFNNLKSSIINKDYNTFEYKCFRRTIERIYYEGILGKGVTSCLHKRDILNIDIYGNIYRCQNLLDKIDGTILNLENVEESVNELANRCKECPIQFACPKCPRVMPDKQKYYCYFQKEVTLRMLRLFDELIDMGWGHDN